MGVLHGHDSTTAIGAPHPTFDALAHAKILALGHQLCPSLGIPTGPASVTRQAR
jgi:hypothetical protein